MIRIIILVLALLPLRPLHADPVPGQSAPDFTAAVETWLDSDEAAALEQFSELAAQGNAAAQMLLGLIDKSPALQGPWLAQLPRADRIGIMRAPGGLSGRNWMHFAAEESELAGLWLTLWDIETPIGLVVEFAAAGENRAARETVLALAARERRGFSILADSPEFPPSLRAVIWKEWSEGAPPLEPERAALHPGDPQRRMMGETPEDDAVADWLLSAPEAAPITALCTGRCAETAPDCALAAHYAMGGHPTLLAFGTPSETLIPAEIFNNSLRGQAALLRRALLSADARGRSSLLARARSRDECFADLLEQEAQRYRRHTPQSDDRD